MPTLPMKRPFEAMLNDAHGRIEPPRWSWDGSPDTVITQTHSVLFAKAATKILQMEGYDVLETDLTTLQSESDAASSGPEDKIQVMKKKVLTRKEAKALEREIPWRQIVKLPKDQIDHRSHRTRACGADHGKSCNQAQDPQSQSKRPDPAGRKDKGRGLGSP